LREAQALADAGKLKDAVRELRSVEQQSLNIVDRIALRRG